MAAKYVVNGDQDRIIDVRMCEIKRQLRQTGGSPLDPDYVAWVLQQVINGTARLVRSRPDTVIVPDLPPADLLALFEREFEGALDKLSSVHEKYRGWNFRRPRDGRGRDERLEVLTWKPDGHKTTQQVIDHFTSLSADGDTAAFLTWIMQTKPAGYYVTVPSDDRLLCHGGADDITLAPLFIRIQGTQCLLDLVPIAGGRNAGWVYVAFRKISG